MDEGATLRNKLLAAVMLAGAAIAFAGTPSGAASHSTTTKPPANRVDAYWFSIPNHFAGGAQWTYSVHRGNPGDTVGLLAGGIGRAAFSGPNKATIQFEMPDSRALSDGYTGWRGLSHAVANVVQTGEMKVQRGPFRVTLGRESALYVDGLDYYGNFTVMVVGYNPKNRMFASVTLTSPAAADIPGNEQVMQALITSFRYEH